MLCAAWSNAPQIAEAGVSEEMESLQVRRVALRSTGVSTLHPASTGWPGER
jgi:hypothetical protein